jgi:DNA polymerase-3 subunit epsilon
MNLFTRWFGVSVELPHALASRLQAWERLGQESERVPLDKASFVVVDVETSGLDPRKDRLLAIGACELEAGRLHAGKGFERIVFQEEASEKENILIHGIAPGEQASGVPPEQALLDFLDYAGKRVLVAYHAMFDRTVIDRTTHEVLGVRLPNQWLDLAELAPALYPEARLPHASLDEWLYRFDIQVRARHRAMDDVLATGELMLILLKRARERGLHTVSQLLAAAESQHHGML